MDKGLAGDSEKEALYVHIRPPQGGRAKGPRCGHSPRPPARAYGAPPRGACGPGPLGCAPCAPFGARAPATCRPMRRGAVGCPPWVGNTRGQGLAAIPAPLPHVFFIKKRRRPGQLECVKRLRFAHGRRQFRAWLTHEPEGLSTPLWCGQVSYPCGEKA